MNIKEVYQQAMPELKKKFNYSNTMAVPRLIKATVNVGVGRHAKDKAYIEAVVKAVAGITGQQPILVRAKKSVSAFKVRQGDIVGIMATIRGQRMYDFVSKLVGVTFPRIRDFRGIDPKAVDQYGNIAVGFKEQIAFPEVSADKVDMIHGLEVCLHTSAQTHQEGLALFEMLGFPFKKEHNNNK